MTEGSGGVGAAERAEERDATWLTCCNRCSRRTTGHVLAILCASDISGCRRSGRVHRHGRRQARDVFPDGCLVARVDGGGCVWDPQYSLHLGDGPFLMRERGVGAPVLSGVGSNRPRS